MKVKKYIKNDYNQFKNGLNDAEDKYHYTIYYFYNSMSLKVYLAVLTIILGVIGYLIESEGPLLSFIKTLQMFTLDFPLEELSTNPFLLVSTIFATLTVFSTVLFAFFKDIINKRIAKNIISNHHTVVFGLGIINRTYLNSVKKASDIVIIEADGNNNYIEEYRARGFGVIVGDVLSKEQLDTLNYRTMNKALIALGNDRVNIELAVQIIEKLQEQNIETDTRLMVHIANSELKALFHKNFINPQGDKTIQLDIKTFSFYEECSKNLFDNHLPITKEYIDSNKSFSSVVIGTNELALSIIKDLLLLLNFPQKNTHTIHLINENSTEFFKRVELATNYTKEKFPFVKFKVIDVAPTDIKFYNEKAFYSKNLLNVYLCDNEEETNLNLAIQLHERVYLKHSELKAKIYFGMYNEYSLSEKINLNRDFFDRFYTFGNNEEIFSESKLIDEEGYMLAKLIHNGYGDEFKRELKNIRLEDINKKWFKTSSYSDKLSNIAQAKHIDIKLLALGFSKEKAIDKSKEELLLINQSLFDKTLVPLLKSIKLDYDFIHQYSLELDKVWSEKPYEVMYMPEGSDNLFELLIDAEHERWNSYHYLNGWDYNIKKDKEHKQHNCLKPLSEFNEADLQITVIYDMYSILYIPNYLAEAGYVMKEID